MNRRLPGRSSTQPTEASMNPSLRVRSTPSTEVHMKHRRRFLTPKSLYRGLAHELHLLAPVYARLRTTHPVLAMHPTLPSLLEYVTNGVRDEAKKILLAALISIHQSAPHRLWVAILLRAFRPMLAKVWKKLFGSDGQERLALLIWSFQEAIRDIDPHRDSIRIAMYVRQATRRKVIDALTQELQWDEVGFGEEADEHCDPRAADPPTRERLRAAQNLLRPGELSAHVRKTFPDLSDQERARVYHQLRRALQRAFPATACANEVTP
jgi:hypothetical protein